MEKYEPESSGSEPALLIERLARVMRAAEYEAGLDPVQWEALRYLARCNRFSNSPTGLTAYLAATKGTISQTIKVLERKGLIERKPREGEGRSIVLTLTHAGEAILQHDPWHRVTTRVAAFGENNKNLFRNLLQSLVMGELNYNGLKTFGVCRSCRFFVSDGAVDDPNGPHRCGLLNVALRNEDANRICAEHEVPSHASHHSL